jgi:diguanylate cyclase (GGDEF)-like protein
VRVTLVPVPAILRGGPLLSRLLALVLVPLVGLGVYTGLILDHLAGQVDAAGHTVSDVDALVRLSAVRSALQDEVLPEYYVVFAHSSTADEGVGDDLRATLDRTYPMERIMGLRAVTDAAIAALPPREHREVASSTAFIGQIRGVLDALPSAQEAGTASPVAADGGLLQLIRSQRSGPFQGYLDFLEDSDQLQTRLTVDAGTESTGAMAQDLRQAQTAVEIVASRSRMIPMVSYFALLPGDLRTPDTYDWLKEWGSYRDHADDLAEAPASPFVTRARATLASNAVVGGDRAVLERVEGVDDQVTFDDVATLFLDNIAANNAFEELLVAANTDAAHQAASDHARAVRDLWRASLIAGLLTLLSLGVVVLVGVSIRRPLRRLAGQAERISEGRLVVEPLCGPREARSIGTALNHSADNLGRMQEQAELLARGELDAPELGQALPGTLGAALQASIQRVVVTMREREELREDLAHQAHHDSLTGLPNRLAAMHLTESALRRGRRDGRQVGLLFVDLDLFKRVNDTFGHAAGDQVLQTTAARLATAVRGDDTVCRLGGDEFVVVVADATVADLTGLAQRIIDAVTVAVPVGTRHVAVGASVGIAHSEDCGVDAGAFLAEADAAGYRAKSSGRGCWNLFDDELRNELAGRARMEQALTEALEHGEFEMYYQPVVEVETGVRHGYEALIRWQRPGLGLVPPDEFIPVAERSSLISDIGRWVLGEATRQLAEWTAQAVATGGVRPTMAVNISGRHLASPRVLDDVRWALEQSGVDPTSLVVELTETVLVSDGAVTDHLKAIRALGVRIAIDDFGTGYTSIGQLQRLPIDILKIDRSFIHEDFAGNEELVRLIVSTAHVFDLEVVAEGVEEVGQLEGLSQLNCDLAQGYLFSRPAPPAAFTTTDDDRDAAPGVYGRSVGGE